ncbi:ATP-binding protein [Sphingoaurantiacus capsulatus]|uniref:histidine kinase n=1 Tax=Sphingoaurantiacus capsulatus TaxID=1771310 RepID=A0ABV7XAH3_9SPHN
MSSYRDLGRSTFRDLRLHLTWREAASSVFIVAVSSSLAVWSEPFIGLVSAALLFVLGVMLVGALHGLAAALIAAFVAFLIYNFFLTEPFLTFRFTTTTDAAPFVAFNFVALIAGVLAGRLQDRAKAAQRANLQLASLLETGQLLQAAVRREEVLATLAASAPARLGLALHAFLQEGGRLVALGNDAGPDVAAIAQLVWTANMPTQQENAVAIPLSAARGPIGVLVAAGEHATDTVDIGFLSALGGMLALALERAELSSRISEASALARSEELKTALLSSVSHDFRTPIAAISASATSLRDYGDRLDANAREQLLRSIIDEGERLNRYTANLLEMSKLQAGLRPAGEVIDVVELVGTVLQRMRGKLGGRKLERQFPDGPLLVRADAALFELALVNLLSNSIAYSDDGARIVVVVRVEVGEAAIDVCDAGFGIPETDLQRVFERFQRVARYEAAPKGSGLGLAIAKGFVEAFDGRIWAETPGLDGRGTRIAIRLPIAASGDSAP